MVSTLDILKKEKELVDEINRWDRYIEIVRSQLEDTKKYTLDCEVRAHDMGIMESTIKEYQLKKGELLDELAKAQIELQDHLSYILDLHRPQFK